MEHLADGAQSTAIADRSTSDLVKLLSEQVSVLVRDELKLTQREMTDKGKQAGVGAGLMGGGGLLALYGVACLIACAIIALAGVISAWLAALIVGAALLAAAAVAALLGKSRVQKATPPVPRESVARVRTDVDVIKQRTRR
jgi:Putative Actinobacterial Holin-X, holin superfamily III